VNRLHRNPAAKQIAAATKPFSSTLGKALKPALDNVQAAGRTKGSIMWTLISILYRAYCRARLLEIRKYHLAG